MQVAVISSAFPSKKSAEKCAKVLLSKKIISCANIFPCFSMYVWKGKNVAQKEFVADFKTSALKWNAAKIIIEKIHPYKIPAINMRIEKSTEKYANWVSSQLK